MEIVQKEDRQEIDSTSCRERGLSSPQSLRSKLKVFRPTSILGNCKILFTRLRLVSGQGCPRSQREAISFLCSFFLCMFFVSCSVNEPTSVQNTNANTQNSNPPVAVSHGNKPQTSDGNAPNKGGMTGKPIDTSKFDADIKKAEEKYNKNKSDNAAKMALAKAYLDRADALTEVAQYRSALGDYRRVLKLDPDNEDAKRMSGEIIRIFQSLNREPPKEGEEPPPLPYNK